MPDIVDNTNNSTDKQKAKGEALPPASSQETHATSAPSSSVVLTSTSPAPAAAVEPPVVLGRDLAAALAISLSGFALRMWREVTVRDEQLLMQHLNLIREPLAAIIANQKLRTDFIFYLIASLRHASPLFTVERIIPILFKVFPLTVGVNELLEWTDMIIDHDKKHTNKHDFVYLCAIIKTIDPLPINDILSLLLSDGFYQSTCLYDSYDSKRINTFKNVPQPRFINDFFVSIFTALVEKRIESEAFNVEDITQLLTPLTRYIGFSRLISGLSIVAQWRIFQILLDKSKCFTSSGAIAPTSSSSGQTSLPWLLNTTEWFQVFTAWVEALDPKQKPTYEKFFMTLPIADMSSLCFRDMVSLVTSLFKLWDADTCLAFLKPYQQALQEQFEKAVVIDDGRLGTVGIYTQSMMQLFRLFPAPQRDVFIELFVDIKALEAFEQGTWQGDKPGLITLALRVAPGKLVHTDADQCRELLALLAVLTTPIKILIIPTLLRSGKLSLTIGTPEFQAFLATLDTDSAFYREMVPQLDAHWHIYWHIYRNSFAVRSGVAPMSRAIGTYADAFIDELLAPNQESKLSSDQQASRLGIIRALNATDHRLLLTGLSDKYLELLLKLYLYQDPGLGLNFYDQASKTHLFSFEFLLGYYLLNVWRDARDTINQSQLTPILIRIIPLARRLIHDDIQLYRLMVLFPVDYWPRLMGAYRHEIKRIHENGGAFRDLRFLDGELFLSRERMLWFCAQVKTDIACYSVAPRASLTKRPYANIMTTLAERFRLEALEVTQLCRLVLKQYDPSSVTGSHASSTYHAEMTEYLHEGGVPFGLSFAEAMVTYYRTMLERAAIEGKRDIHNTRLYSYLGDLASYLQQRIDQLPESAHFTAPQMPPIPSSTPTSSTQGSVVSAPASAEPSSPIAIPQVEPAKQDHAAPYKFSASPDKLMPLPPASSDALARETVEYAP